MRNQVTGWNVDAFLFLSMPLHRETLVLGLIFLATVENAIVLDSYEEVFIFLSYLLSVCQGTGVLLK